MLALEIMRRAAHDWILYRDSIKPQQKLIADDAYHWIFVEEPDSEAWQERIRSNKQLTSFFSVCDILSVNPKVAREYVKRLTIKEILSTGRPPTYRRQKERRKREPVAPVVQAVTPVAPPAPAKPTPIKVIQGPRLVIAIPTRLLVPTSAPVRAVFDKAVNVVSALKHLAQTLG